VFVPCSVMGLGLQPRRRVIRGEIFSTVGKDTRFPA